MISNQTGHGTIYVDLECGAQFGIEFACSMLHYPPCGNGWNSSREPAHWEAEDFEPTALVFVHPDGYQTTLQAQPGSLLYLFLRALLEKQTSQDLTGVVGEYEL